MTSFSKLIFMATALAAVMAFGACQSKTDAPSRSAALMAEAYVHADRLLAVDGTQNTRDLGGYKTADGRTVKWGMLYRSDNLHELSKSGKETIASLGIRAVTDLRSEKEIEDEPDKLPVTAPPLDYRILPINDVPVDIKVLGRQIVKGEIDEAQIMMLLDHRRFITNPAHRKSWGDWAKSLDDDARTPHLFHCTSGKDRAGYGAAIMLLILGVPKETVMDDFLLSNMVYADYIDKMVGRIDRFTGEDVDTDLIRKVMGVSRETLEATFAEMETQFGSIDAFIKEGLGIDDDMRKALQDRFLEG